MRSVADAAVGSDALTTRRRGPPIWRICPASRSAICSASSPPATESTEPFASSSDPWRKTRLAGAGIRAGWRSDWPAAESVDATAAISIDANAPAVHVRFIWLSLEPAPGAVAAGDRDFSRLRLRMIDTPETVLQKA